MKFYLTTIILFVAVFLCSATNVFASLEGITPTPEIINPQSTTTCTDFKFRYEKESSSSYDLPTPPPDSDVLAFDESPPVDNSGNKETTGEIYYNDTKIPDFSTIHETLSSAVDKLTPQDLKDMFSVSAPSFTAKVRHFVLGTTKEGQIIPFDKSKDKTAETTESYPSWWPNLIAKMAYVNGMFGTRKTAPKSPVFQISEPINTVSDSSYKSTCAPDGENSIDNTAVKSSEDPQFRATSFWEIISRAWKDFIEGITKQFQSSSEKNTLADNSRGKLAGGGTIKAEAELFKASLPEDLVPKKNTALSQKASFTLSSGYTTTDETKSNAEEMNFLGMGKVRAQYCLDLCSRYPADIAARIDPLCPSCDASAYAQGTSSVDDPVLDMAMCKMEATGCEYCWQRDSAGWANQSCQGDPTCEGDKCCPLQYRLADEYSKNFPGCAPPYSGIATNCNDSAVCRLMTFEQNPNGGWGSCQYKNRQVCVRTDREKVDSCAALCSWDCCEYQK